MSQQMQIKIGPSFFAKAKNDYSDWRWAWVRELCQNSIDAPGCDKIDFSFHYNADTDRTFAACINNGMAMSKDVLINKFLSIGESGKNFNGSVGGFGKAKELIAFCHESYSIRTGTYLVEGSGAEFTLTEDLEYYDGTTTSVFMSGDHTERLVSSVQRFAAFAQWHGTIELCHDGVSSVLECVMHKGAARRDFSFGKKRTWFDRF